MSRIQWVERTVPPGDEIGRYLGEAWARDVVPLDSLAMRSYLELTSRAPAVTRDHELFVSVQIDAKRAWRPIKRMGGEKGPDAGACAVLLREVEALAERLAAADVRVYGRASAGMVATAIRVAFDPWSRPGSRAGGRRPRPRWHRRGRRMAARNGGVVECVPDGRRRSRHLLDRELAACRRRRRLPLPLLHTQDGAGDRGHDRADLPAEGHSRGRGISHERRRDRELRGRMGFIETAGRKRQTEAVARREEELADGHAAVRFAGYVTVSAHTLDELERLLGDRARRQMSRLELLRLYGQQGERSPTRCRSAGGCGEGAGQPGHRATTAHIQAAYPFVAEGGLGAAACTSAGTCTAAPSVTTRGSCTARS